MKTAHVIRMTALIALCALAPACIETDIPPAGSYSEVLLVSELGADDPLGKVAYRHLTRSLDFYVSTEPQFEVQQVRAADLEDVPYVKNIVFCGTSTLTGDIGRLITTLLSPQSLARVESGEANIFKKEDSPTAGQLTVIITGRSDDAIFDVLRDRGDDINETIEASCRKRMRGYLLKNRDKKLSQHLQQKYGFYIDVSPFYKLFSEETEGVEFMRNGPARSLGVFWLDWDSEPTISDRKRLFDARAAYVNKHYDGDEMDWNRVEFSAARLGKYPAIKMEGYWSNANSVAGGYFQTYFVYAEQDRLVWAIDMLVYAPGLPKHAHFRELLAIAETFHYD